MGNKNIFYLTRFLWDSHKMTWKNFLVNKNFYLNRYFLLYVFYIILLYLVRYFHKMLLLYSCYQRISENRIHWVQKAMSILCGLPTNLHVFILGLLGRQLLITAPKSRWSSQVPAEQMRDFSFYVQPHGSANKDSSIPFFPVLILSFLFSFLIMQAGTVSKILNQNVNRRQPYLLIFHQSLFFHNIFEDCRIKHHSVSVVWDFFLVKRGLCFWKDCSRHDIVILSVYHMRRHKMLLVSSVSSTWYRCCFPGFSIIKLSFCW